MADRKIKIAHLYAEVLNLYGDRGNILCLKKRLEWRGIECEVTEVKLGDNQDFTDYDIFFIGGGQDFEQEVLLNDLKTGKGRKTCFRKGAEPAPEHEKLRAVKQIFPEGPIFNNI